MKIKTQKLENTALDWAVAKCEGFGEDAFVDVQRRPTGSRVPQNMRKGTPPLWCREVLVVALAVWRTRKAKLNNLKEKRK